MEPSSIDPNIVDCDPPPKTYNSIPYGGIPETIREQMLLRKDDDGWAMRRGEACDWNMSTSPQWGEVIEQPIIDPFVNLRKDFDICGLEWNGPSNCDTSLDRLDTHDWAQTQLHRTTELGRILDAGDPTFTVPQILQRLQELDKYGAQRAGDIKEYDAELEMSYKHMQMLLRSRAHASREIGALRDTKAQLEDLRKIAYARLCPDE